MKLAASSGPPSPGSSCTGERRLAADGTLRLRPGLLKYVQFRALVLYYHKYERNQKAVFCNYLDTESGPERQLSPSVHLTRCPSEPMFAATGEARISRKRPKNSRFV